MSTSFWFISCPIKPPTLGSWPIKELVQKWNQEEFLRENQHCVKVGWKWNLLCFFNRLLATKYLKIHQKYFDIGQLEIEVYYIILLQPWILNALAMLMECTKLKGIWTKSGKTLIDLLTFISIVPSCFLSKNFIFVNM